MSGSVQHHLSAGIAGGDKERDKHTAFCHHKARTLVRALHLWIAFFPRALHFSEPGGIWSSISVCKRIRSQDLLIYLCEEQKVYTCIYIYREAVMARIVCFAFFISLFSFSLKHMLLLSRGLVSRKCCEMHMQINSHSFICVLDMFMRYIRKMSGLRLLK